MFSVKMNLQSLIRVLLKIKFMRGWEIEGGRFKITRAYNHNTRDKYRNTHFFTDAQFCIILTIISRYFRTLYSDNTP